MAALLRRARRVGVLLAWVVALNTSLSVPVRAQKTETTDITVFAAASLKTALDAVVTDYQKSTGGKVTVSYAASSALAKQIEQSAPADLFISADLDWMDYLTQKNLIKPGSRINLLGNRLVLIAPATSKANLKIAKDVPLADGLGSGKLAMADVKAVPAGKYGKAALEKLDVWAAVEPKVAQAENVRAALALVAREEAILGVVYQTDATSEPKVRVVDTFPANSHAPIVYPVAVTAEAKNAESASAFVRFLKTPDAQARFVKEGFTILNEAAGDSRG
jgi:molybdate transport system substrate-binding protein